ncbi:DUF4159 domain-containing protein, partial [Xanthomonas sp. LMG 8992]|nr:DUF4159 domain-containing protein [Xanthomonas sp. LMG 8992]
MTEDRDWGVGSRDSESAASSPQPDVFPAPPVSGPRASAPSAPRRHFLGLLLGGVAALALPQRARAAGNYDFWLTRLRYDSGDWDVDARMPSNLITSL